MKVDALVTDPVASAPNLWAWLERVAGGTRQMAIVVCAGPSTPAERIRALQLGVDDWIGKPAHPGEVIVRVEVAVRRRRMAGRPPRAPAEPRATLAGELDMRPGEHQVYVDGVSAALTRREFDVLRVLVEHGGRVVERDAIYSLVWGSAMVAGDRSVDVHIRKIRSKLRVVSPAWSYIHTQFRVGYRFHPERIDHASSLPQASAGQAP